MPPLTGWLSTGGDPCSEMWQGIECFGRNVVAIRLSGLSLRGSLGDGLFNLTSLLTLDLSNNHIGQVIPIHLPPQIQQMNFGSNVLIGTIPSSLKYFTFLTSLNLSGNLLSGSIPDVFQNFKNLTTLDLSSNNFTGGIPASFSNLSRLTTLHLQDDQLNGTLQAFAKLPLKDLNIEANEFTGLVPGELMTIPNFRYNGNHLNFSPYARSSTPTLPPGATGESLNSSTRRVDPASNSCQKHPGYDAERRCFTGGQLAGIVIAAAVAVFCFLLLVALLSQKTRLGHSLKQNRVATDPPLKASSTEEHEGAFQEEKVQNSAASSSLCPSPSPSPLRQFEKFLENFPGSPSNSKSNKHLPAAAAFAFNELLIATNNFSQENLVGEGMLGCVYKAELANGQALAIKRLNNPSNSVPNDEDFFRLISNISRLRHGNIMELVGYCTNQQQQFLVYNYHKKGTLHDLLHSTPQKEQPLSWVTRMKITLGASRALEYLHEVCIPPVIHRSFKSTNILLDDQLNPHLSDCGLEVLMPLHTESQVSFDVLNSFGYSAPEYVLYGMYMAKSDVFSFGVLMLELITGRKALDSSRPRSEQSLVRWATPQLHDLDALANMVDPSLNGMYPAKALWRCAEIVSSCVQIEPDSRPSMSEIVQSLIRLMQRTGSTKWTISSVDCVPQPQQQQQEEDERAAAIFSEV
ncbi:hypothetical protein O6H91_04G038100 [Diphasiastrum complanatum]|nr:hypothetical protein O6H91_04G038100 [Diphasiastrum complanatum]KAJ7558415.1 hypothetical protein O6H91_04G038100 [Diphasiastrum complanatum]